jgi:hypothetical protein
MNVSDGMRAYMGNVSVDYDRSGTVAMNQFIIDDLTLEEVTGQLHSSDVVRRLGFCEAFHLHWSQGLRGTGARVRNRNAWTSRDPVPTRP